MKNNNLETQQSKAATAEEKTIIDNNKQEITIPNDLYLFHFTTYPIWKTKISFRSNF